MMGCRAAPPQRTEPPTKTVVSTPHVPRCEGTSALDLPAPFDDAKGALRVGGEVLMYGPHWLARYWPSEDVLEVLPAPPTVLVRLLALDDRTLFADPPAGAAPLLFDLVNHSWSALPAGKCSGLSTMVDERHVLVFGVGDDIGTARPPPLACAAILDVRGPSWRVAPLPPAHPDHAHVRVGDEIVFFGGSDSDPESWETSAAIQAYHPRRNQWREAGRLKRARVAASALVLDSGRIFVAGGCSNTAWCGASGDSLVKSGELVDLGAKTSDEFEADVAANQALLRLIDGRIVAIGGVMGDTPKGPATMLFDPDARPLGPAAPLRFRRNSALSAVLIEDGRVLVVGGTENSDPNEPLVEIWSPDGPAPCPSPPSSD